MAEVAAPEIKVDSAEETAQGLAQASTDDQPNGLDAKTKSQGVPDRKLLPWNMEISLTRSRATDNKQELPLEVDP